MTEYDDGILLDAAAEEDGSLLAQLGMEDKNEASLNRMRALAKKGDERAILWMGLYYLRRDGLEPDVAEALYWLNKSNDAQALELMALIYEKDGPIELARAFRAKAARS